jgi:MipA family protein
MTKFMWPVLLFGVAFGAVAQTEDADDEGAGGPGPPRWAVGLGMVASDSPYAGEGTRLQPIPLISFQGERFSFSGISANWRIFGGDTFELSALGKLRFDGFDVKDLGKRELATNGVDYRLLEDRDKGFDGGLGMKWSGKAGEFEIELLTDLTDASGGQEASIQYGYPFELGKGRLTPSVGITWLSEDSANYYYGTLDEEVARGVVDYKPDAFTIPHVGVSYFRPIGDKWTALAFLKYSSLPDEIKDSPFIDPDADGQASIFVGFSRGF